MKTKEELYEEYGSNSAGLEMYLIDKGFKPLGWQVHSGNCDEIKKCSELGHYKEGLVQDISHRRSGSDNTNWCPECKHYYKIDSSG